MWPPTPHTVQPRGRAARAQRLRPPPGTGAVHVCPPRPLSDRRRMGRKDVAVFFRFIRTCPGGEADSILHGCEIAALVCRSSYPGL